MAVFSLLLGGDKHAVDLCTSLLLREMDTGGGCGMKDGTVSLALVLFLTAPSLTCLHTFNCWTNLASKVIKQAEDDRPSVVNMDRPYKDNKAESCKRNVLLTCLASNIDNYVYISVIVIQL